MSRASLFSQVQEKGLSVHLLAWYLCGPGLELLLFCFGLVCVENWISQYWSNFGLVAAVIMRSSGIVHLFSFGLGYQRFL